MLQHDLQTAIASLKISTAAIDRQSEGLRAQRKHLESLQRQRQFGEDSLKLRARQLASQNMALAVEENKQSLTSQLQGLEEGFQGMIKQVVPSVTAYLHHDDRYLQNLEDMSVLEASDGKGLMMKVEQLAVKLSNLTQEEIECRLDRVYLHELWDKDNNEKDGQSEVRDQELEEDLKSLYVEIRDVAVISAFQGFKAPLLRALAEVQDCGNNRASTVLGNINNRLSDLLETAATCVSRLEGLRSYGETVSAYRADFDALTQKFESETAAARQNGNRRAETVSEPVMDILRRWNVPVLEHGSVEQAMWARKRKLKQIVYRSCKTMDDTILTHVNGLPVTSERLLETTPTTGAEAHILKLEQEIQQLHKLLDRIDLADIKREDGPKAAFVARWADPMGIGTSKL